MKGVERLMTEEHAKCKAEGHNPRTGFCWESKGNNPRTGVHCKYCCNANREPIDNE